MESTAQSRLPISGPGNAFVLRAPRGPKIAIDPTERAGALDLDLRNLSQLWAEVNSANQSLGLNVLYQRLKEIDTVERLLKEHAKKFENFYSWAKENQTILPSLDKHRYQVNVLGTLLQEQQATARKHVNDLSRPHLRPLHIVDMPDEVLVTIFEALRSWNFYNFHVPRLAGDPSDIKNVRLTCRRLYNTSSHLLISSLSVDISNPPSLGRLEKISHHSIFSKSIQAVHVGLDFYDSTLASDFSAFTDYAITKLQKETDFAKHLSRMPSGSVSSETIRKNRRLGKAVLDQWKRLARGEPDRRAGSAEGLMQRDFLRRVHDDYFCCQLWQKNNQNVFIGTFAASMARLPLARVMRIRDDNFKNRRDILSYSHAANKNGVYRAISKNLLLPLQWQEAREFGVGPPPAALLAKILVAIHQSGVSLKKLSITISAPEDLSAFALSDERLRELTASLQSVQDLDLSIPGYGRHLWPIREPIERRALQTFLKALVNSGNLNSFELDLSFLEYDTEERDPSFSIGPVIDCGRIRRVSNIKFYGLPLHFEEFEKLVKSRDPEKGSLCLDRVRLLSGKWADVLDTLRERDRFAIIRSPLGAECDVLSEEKIEEIFGREGAPLSSGTRYRGYTMGWSDKNPLRDLTPEPSDAEDSDDAEDSSDDDDSSDEDESGDSE